jgi:ubiquinone/menaquinone biosynthesis C-methylase UbiE
MALVALVTKPQPATLLTATMPSILPVVREAHRRVLDLGCGRGDTLEELSLPRGAFRVGMDVEANAVKTGARQRGAAIRFVAGDGHRLPFTSGFFDLVISRVAFPYMNIPVTLAEVARVLRGGGQVWMTLHPVRMAATRILASLKAGRIHDVVYQGYAVANGLALAYLGRQFRYPLNRRRIESVQTLRGAVRALSDAGFSEVQFERRSRGPGHEDADARYGRVFAVAGRKPPSDA